MKMNDLTDEGDEGGEGVERDSPASPVPEAGQERQQWDGQEKVKNENGCTKRKLYSLRGQNEDMGVVDP